MSNRPDPATAPRTADNDNQPVDPRQVAIARLIWKRHKAAWLARLKRFLMPPKSPRS